MNGAGRSVSYESDGEARNISSSGLGSEHKRDNDLRSNLCDYSDEEDERLDIDDESSDRPIMGSNCGRKLLSAGSADKVEGNETLAGVLACLLSSCCSCRVPRAASRNLIYKETERQTVLSIRRSIDGGRNSSRTRVQRNNAPDHMHPERRASCE